MKNFANLLIGFGVIAALTGLVIFVFTFFPIFKNEISYIINNPDENNKAIKPVDENFGIVIPKINANSKVIPNVNPYKESEYQYALTKGVAHARGTVYPGQNGNVFLFAHSSVDFYEALKYNSVFYLLYKLKKDDELYVYHKDEKYTYKVSQLKYVDPTSFSFLTSTDSKSKLTLMTCWPPGTTFKRLVVIADPVEIKQTKNK